MYIERIALTAIQAWTTLAMVAFAATRADAQRVVVPLDGDWAIADGVRADEMPSRFDHTVAVPGLVNQSKPAFPDVDQYESQEFIGTMKGCGVLPESERCDELGRTRQKRNYFWYQRTFTAPARRQSAQLVVNKAQFGTAVWLNGQKVGEHWGCFTAGRFNVTDAMRWNAENRLVIRIGAHPGVVPEWAPLINDGEKEVWTPGIYDSVSLRTADNPVIENVQVAPRIGKSEILVQTRLKNFGPAGSFDVNFRLRTWKSGQPVGAPVVQRVDLAAGEERLATQTIPVPGAVLWSPDNPFLYVLDTSSNGDSCSSRFGMREFRCDSSTGRAMLNGKIVFLRGSSITLHRFFGDPQCGGLPWDDAWVRRLLVDLPKQMHWNAFRICIGVPPERWLDIADEAGLLLQYEFPIWSDRKPFRHKFWKADELISQFREFVSDNWNHPSIVIWDASNETRSELLAEKVVPAVRGMDLSNRPWDNGYNKPGDANDPVETHPYFFIDYILGKPPYFQIEDLERKTDGKQRGGIPFPPHPSIINEYDWLWLRRDGMPTILSRKVYEHLLGANATPAQRIELNAYLLAGLTEFWRAYRNHAGVMYLAYLDADRPTSFTCDNFRDVRRLQFHPEFERYMGEAFKPLGVYVNFFQPKLPAGSERTYRVMMVNDTDEAALGRLELVWQAEGGARAAASSQRRFEVPALGQANYDITLATPAAPGNYVLAAKAHWDGKSWSPTIARRKVLVNEPQSK
ncbi:MAG: hypothetical protein KKE86_13915 [Planctomycetes bacterium]|nr:hypothetical protein [Planctomycetota bacterium]